MHDGGDIHKALHHALENLQAKGMPHMVIEPTDVGDAITLDTNFDASLILLYDLWKDQLLLQGEPVIALIARDLLVVAESHNTTQVNALQALVTKLFPEAAYSLSPELFTFKENKLVLYQTAIH